MEINAPLDDELEVNEISDVSRNNDENGGLSCWQNIINKLDSEETFSSLFLLPGKLFSTFGVLIAVVACITFIIHMIVLFGTMTFIRPENKKLTKFGLLLTILFGLNMSNIAIIPIYNFFSFTYFNDPFGDFIRKFYRKFNRNTTRLNNIFSITTSILCIIFIVMILFCLGGGTKSSFNAVDIFMMVFLVILPLLKLILEIFGYVINGYISFIKGSFISEFNDESNNEGQNEKIHQKDAIMKALYNQTSIASIIKGEGNMWQFIWEIYHIVSLIVFLGYFIGVIIYTSQSKSWLIILKKKLLMPLMIRVRFPFYFILKKNRCNDCCCKCKDCCCKCKKKKIVKKETNSQNKLVAGISKKNFFINIFLVLILIGNGFSNINKNSGEYDIYPLDSTYQHIYPDPEPTINDTDKEIVSQMCYVKPYGLKMLNYIVLAHLSYIDLNDSNVDKVIREFFDLPSNNITINSYGQKKLHKFAFGGMSYFNIDQFNLTIVSIRGSTEGIDWVLDFQMFLSSALLTLVSPLSLLTRDRTPQTMNAIRKIWAAPLAMAKGSTIVSKYVQELDDYYQNVSHIFNNNIIFVGHSLGGGLAKLFGHIKGKAAISISGPGITLFQTLYPGKRKDLDSIFSEADIIPDGDPIPRVERSAATTYRTLCNKGAGTCHGILHTICMVGLMCQTPHHNFCRHLDSSTSIFKYYDDMIKYVETYN
ncbi:hypothetical protein TRFO_02022 [Tritrichomonas foetus]|uniref:Fungal lipase-type domain-containing protein n=1 Tax=Tritrichomonas foetus TaxID=1144522 RepID=A0A1J4JCK5_9EUKA|nr:hypothetical protein TRFO_02022 [Tritrichomonas foetus]|eukprot:OHS96910.1 hypothetical protein TRFO_02022 [Tritrichomonas foetus]